MATLEKLVASTSVAALGARPPVRWREEQVSKTVAVTLDDDHWFWAYDVSLAMLAVEVMRLVEEASLPTEPWLGSLLNDLRMAVLAQGTFGLQVPTDLTHAQRETLQTLFARAGERLRARSSVTAEQAAMVYVVNDRPVFLRGASTVDTTRVADLADAVVELLRGELPPSPPGTTAWLYGADNSPRGI
jgi:hypothetical protein